MEDAAETAGGMIILLRLARKTIFTGMPGPQHEPPGKPNSPKWQATLPQNSPLSRQSSRELWARQAKESAAALDSQWGPPAEASDDGRPRGDPHGRGLDPTSADGD